MERESGRLLDRVLDADAECDDACGEREVTVEVRLSSSGSAADEHLAVEVVEVDPPEAGSEDEAERGHDAARHAPFDGARTDDDRHHGLAEDDDREEPDAFAEVGGMYRGALHPPADYERRADADAERDAQIQYLPGGGTATETSIRPAVVVNAGR